MNPSTGPLFQLSTSPARTAARSVFRLVAKRLKDGASQESVCANHSSSRSPPSSLIMAANRLRELVGRTNRLIGGPKPVEIGGLIFPKTLWWAQEKRDDVAGARSPCSAVAGGAARKRPGKARK